MQKTKTRQSTKDTPLNTIKLGNNADPKNREALDSSALSKIDTILKILKKHGMPMTTVDLENALKQQCVMEKENWAEATSLSIYSFLMNYIRHCASTKTPTKLRFFYARSGINAHVFYCSNSKSIPTRKSPAVSSKNQKKRQAPDEWVPSKHTKSKERKTGSLKVLLRKAATCEENSVQSKESNNPKPVLQASFGGGSFLFLETNGYLWDPSCSIDHEEMFVDAVKPLKDLNELVPHLMLENDSRDRLEPIFLNELGMEI
ncbi:hypothetical protein SJAG_04075 [Schizosaccharomyces japonicus yFS275]|uniref:Uncharacterized protein n=1 Tax=Schizosaccharomyces japonicus (strain yFS275 / FY16936) TaxID=402676 RepID=B6K5U9_SCHJY|nr:hypothetical protein SJAG_04075 [Schizosaccharomyces japonicus yFS275]EEB08903.1 hypothetical protein SJAG_04075 [Schizosaccharomyces japonicus yFS275]